MHKPNGKRSDDVWDEDASQVRRGSTASVDVGRIKDRQGWPHLPCAHDDQSNDSGSRELVCPLARHNGGACRQRQEVQGGVQAQGICYGTPLPIVNPCDGHDGYPYEEDLGRRRLDVVDHCARWKENARHMR